MIEREPDSVAGLMRTTVPGTGSAKPSTLTSTFCPTAMRMISAAGTAAANSSWRRSTISSSRLSGATFSPGCTVRLLTRPDSGARITVSASDLRAPSSAPRAESRLARAISYWLAAVV